MNGRSTQSLRLLALLALMLTLLVAGQVMAQEPSEERADSRFVKIVAQSRPAVVAVGSYRADDAPSVRYYGTGFAVADGTIVVTNAHVVEAIRVAGRLEDLRLYLPDTTSIQGISARLVAMDSHHDVAMLHAAYPVGASLELEMSRLPLQGESVGVIGYPIGMALGVVPTVHKGVVSAVVPAVLPLPRGARLTPELAEAIRRPYQLYQLDMVVYPGNSGSPLIDAHTGKVIGIINKTLATRTREHLLDKPSGISYAVPVRWIHELLARTLITMDSEKRR
jgi:serine protease Do